MSEKSLRSKVIRLAHQKPELREHLLPLVKKATETDDNFIKEVEQMGIAYDLDFTNAKSVRYKGKQSTRYWFGTDIMFYGIGSPSLIIDVVENGLYILNTDVGEINRRYQVSKNLNDFLFGVGRSIKDLGEQSDRHNDFYEG